MSPSFLTLTSDCLFIISYDTYFDFRLVFFEYFYHILSFMSASEICISFLISSVIVFVKYFLVSFVNLIPLLIRSFGIEF